MAGTGSDITQLAWVALAAAGAPVIALALRRFAVPGVVIELVLGVLLGPTVLGWVTPAGPVGQLGNFGLAMLMFLAGVEIDLSVLRGRSLARTAGSWGGSLLAALIVGLVLVLAGHRHGEVVIGLSLTTTALGTLLPVLRDAGVVDTAFGRHVLAIGTLGEIGPIVVVALLLGGRRPVLTAMVMGAFFVVAAALAWAVRRPWGATVTESLSRGLTSSSQLPVRIAMLLVVALVFLATRLGLDLLLGAFAAGVVVRAAVTAVPESTQTLSFQAKLDAIGFGVFVPVFFVASGVRLDLSSFGRHPAALAAIPVFVVLLLLARGVPTVLAYRSAVPARELLPLALMAATGLPLIVVITALGVANSYVASQTAAALVSAGVLTVLVCPALATRILSAAGRTTPATSEPGSRRAGMRPAAG